MGEGESRKFIAKRFNEHTKLLATLFNSLSIATFGAAFVVPLAQGQAYMRPAGIEHDVMNGSDHPIAFVEIEVKRPDALKELSL